MARNFEFRFQRSKLSRYPKKETILEEFGEHVFTAADRSTLDIEGVPGLNLETPEWSAMSLLLKFLHRPQRIRQGEQKLKRIKKKEIQVCSYTIFQKTAGNFQKNCLDSSHKRIMFFL